MARPRRRGVTAGARSPATYSADIVAYHTDINLASTSLGGVYAAVSRSSCCGRQRCQRRCQNGGAWWQSFWERVGAA